MSRADDQPHGERIAALEAYSKTQRDSLEKLASAVEKLTGEVVTLNAALAQARGGWAAICAVGAVAGTAAALLVAMFNK